MTQTNTTIKDLEQELYVLQRQHPVTEEWEVVGAAIRGRSAAVQLYRTEQAAHKDQRWRFLPKGEAEHYKEGYNAALWAVAEGRVRLQVVGGKLEVTPVRQAQRRVRTPQFVEAMSA